MIQIRDSREKNDCYRYFEKERMVSPLWLMALCCISFSLYSDTLTTWQYSAAITLNTSATGANIGTTQYNFPVLIRLTASNAAQVFAAARSDGGDLRFTRGGAGDTSQLPYELNKYNAANQTAVIWVKTDSVEGNNATQSITMFWGKSSATTTSDSANVFMPANGFGSVLHLNKRGYGGNTLYDATGQGNNGTASNTVTDTDGVFDRAVAMHCYGTSSSPVAGDSIVIPGVMGSPATVTLSAWVRVDSCDQANNATDGHKATIISMADYTNLNDEGQSGTPIDSLAPGFLTGTNTWNDIGWPDPNMAGSNPWGGLNDTGHAMWHQGWKYAAEVIAPGAGYCKMYLNGDSVKIVSCSGAIPWSGGNSGTAQSGHRTVFGKHGGSTNPQTGKKFGGSICEARIETQIRSSDWIRLCYQNQQPNDSLTSIGTTAAVSGIPVLSSPSNGSTNQSTSPLLSWGSVTGGLSYSLEISTSSGFGSTVLSQGGLSVTSLALTGLANYTTYFWEVNATIGAGMGAWSSVWSFTTVVPAPPSAPPVPALPTNGATNVSISPVLIWGSSAEATSYQLEVSSTANFSTSVYIQGNLADTEQVISGLGGTMTYFWEVRAANAGGMSAWSTAWSFTTLTNFTLPIPQGWNILSLAIHPTDSTVTGVFGDSLMIANRHNFILVKDLGGDVYSPTIGINGLGTVHTGEGYQVFSDSTDTVRLTGTAVNTATTPLLLDQGWNLIAYLPQASMPVTTALQGIVPQILIVKNGSGSIYWPDYGINSLGTMTAGQGYFAYMKDSITLIYDSTITPLEKLEGAGAQKMLSLPNTVHYGQHGNTGNNATVLASRVIVGNRVAADSSEIGAFDAGGNLVGSGTVIHGLAAFPVWGKNTRTNRKDGLAASEEITFKLWNKTAEYPAEFKISGGTGVRYSEQGIFLGTLDVPEGALITTFNLARAYPNPFRGSISIAFDVPSIAGVSQHAVEIGIYDLKGSLVKELAKGIYPAGHYELAWKCFDGRDAAAGSSMYIARMKAANFEKRLKLVRLQ